jgi:tetratricopeptide (TPR) repeat protein
MAAKSLFTLLCVLLAFGGMGCTKEARLGRRMAAGDKYSTAGDFEKAEIEYRGALQLSPNNPEVLSRLGILAYNQGRVPSSYFLLQGVLKKRPEDTAARLHLGLAAMSLGRRSDARAAAKRVIELAPDNEMALLLLAETCVTTRDNEEARRLIEQARDRKETAGHHVALGKLRLDQRDEAGAEKELRRALELDPKSPAAFSELGALYSQKRDTKQAIEALKQAAELSPVRSPRRIHYIQYLVQNGALDDAQREIEKITAKAKDYVPALAEAMKIAFAKGKLDQAEAEAENILKRDRANYDALMQRAAVRLAKGDFEGVISRLKDIERIFNRAPQVKYELALAYQKTGQVTLAEENLAIAIRLSPNFEAAIIQLAELNLQKGDALSVISAITPLVKRQTHQSRAYILLAQAQRAKGDFEEALSILRFLAQGTPTSPEGPYLVGNLEFEMGRRPEARRSFEQSLQIANNYWPALEMLVNLDLVERKMDAAMARIDSLLEKNPKAVPPVVFRAKLRLATGDLKGAEADLTTVVELAPGEQYPYTELVRLYLHENRLEEAAAKLTVLTNKRPTAASWMQLAMVQTALKNADAARSSYEKALALNAKFVPALNNLAFIYGENLGQVEKGLSLANQAKGLASDDPFVNDTLGWLLFRKGQYNAALPLLQGAAEKIPLSPEVQYHQGTVQYYVGMEDLAKKSLEAALAADAAFTAAEDARRRLAVLAIDPTAPPASARKTLEDAVQRESSDPAALTRLGAITALDGDYVQAAQQYELALKTNPRSVSAMLALVEIYFGPVLKVERGRELTKLLRSAAPGDGRIAWKLAQLLQGQGDFAWASTMLQEAERTIGSNPEFLLDLARGQYAVGRVPEAAAALQRLLGLSPRDSIKSVAITMAALIAPPALNAARDKEQIALAERILATDPNSVPALMIVATEQEKSGAFREAQGIYNRILAKYPTFAPAMKQLALIYGEQLADDVKAEELANKARQTLTDDPDLNRELGAIYYRRADYSGAVRYLQQSLRQWERQADAHFLLGMCQFQLKKPSEAMAGLQKALELGLPPAETTEAQRVLQEINRGG